MQTRFWVFGILALCFLTIVGCKKSGSSSSSTAQVQVINATQFRPAFAGAPPEIEALVNEAMVKLQASMYVEALAALDKLGNNPTLTEQQKKAVADLTDQVKRKMAAISSPPNQ